MVRARSLAAIAAAAAAVPTLASAALVNPGPINTPTFSCNAATGGSSINWGDLTTNRSLIIVVMPGTTDQKDMPFGCNASGVPAVQLNGPGDFALDFGSFTDPNTKWADAGKTISWDKETIETTPAGAKFDVLDFNLLLPAVLPSGEKQDNFLGVEFKFFAGDTPFPGTLNLSVNGDGNLIVDPPIPTNGVSVSLYSTPVGTPEPSTLLLLGTGLAGFAGTLRRKKKE